jgi:N-acyl-L-homoserine lactone synthetase
MLRRNSVVAGAQPGNFVEAFSRQSFAKRVSFQPGDLLRQKGVHYRDMFLTIDGDFEVDFEAEGAQPTLRLSGPGAPIGEIGFLRGTAANATVKAASSGSAVLIDDDVLENIERDQPAIATQFLHRLAQVAEERTSFNVLTSGGTPALAKGPAIEILVCRTEETLKRAQRLRYEVYCEELGRQSPFADHAERIISDGLDAFGNTFIALENGEAVGTLRVNEPSLGPLGVLETLYGMNNSVHHPASTVVCTKFVVRKSRRGSPIAFKLIAAVVRYGMQRQLKECYIDCIPALLPYYKAMGFVPCGQRFLHRENGPSDPLMLDLVKYGKRLTVEMGPLALMAFLIRSQTHKLRDRLSGSLSSGA